MRPNALWLLYGFGGAFIIGIVSYIRDKESTPIALIVFFGVIAFSALVLVLTRAHHGAENKKGGAVLGHVAIGVAKQALALVAYIVGFIALLWILGQILSWF